MEAGQDFRPPPGWQGTQQGQQGRHYASGHGGFSESDLGGFSEFFSNLFGGGGGRSHFDGGDDFGHFQQRGNDQHAKISISLEDAFHGATKHLQMQMPEMDASGMMRQSSKTLKVTIPKGATQGQQLRLAKQGGPGLGGAAAGDLYLEIHIEPNHLFSLKDHDVYLTLPVTPWEAALGSEIKVPTLAGPVGLKLPSGSQSGQKLRLKGRGMPSKSHPGDQYVIVQIHVPKPTTEEQKQLYTQMAKIMPFNPRKDWPT